MTGPAAVGGSTRDMLSPSVATIAVQSRPANTTAASIFSPSETGRRAYIYAVTICNTSGAASTFRIFLDVDGSTYDQTTALFYDVPIAADETIQVYEVSGHGWQFANTSGNFAVRSGDANALTFTLIGEFR